MKYIGYYLLLVSSLIWPNLTVSQDLAMDADKHLLIAGERTRLVISVKNNEAGVLHNLRMLTDWPAEIDIQSIEVDRGLLNPSATTWTIDTLEVGTTARLVAEIDVLACGVTSIQSWFDEKAVDRTTLTLIVRSDEEASIDPVLWGIDEDDSEFFSIEQYRSDCRLVSHGRIHVRTAEDELELVPNDIESFTLDSDNTAYMIVDDTVAGLERPVLLSFHLANIRAGETPVATIIGRIPDISAVNGLSIHPDTGELFAQVRQGTRTEADQLVVLNKADASVERIVGVIEGADEVGGNLEDIEFNLMGQLFGTDNQDDHLYRIDPATGRILEVYHSDLRDGLDVDTIKFEALGWDPINQRLIGQDDHHEFLADLSLVDGANRLVGDLTGKGLTDVEGIDFVPSHVDMSMGMTMDKASYRFGDTALITLTAKNKGPAQATCKATRIELPDGLRLVGTSAGDAFVVSNGVWTLHQLDVGETQSLVLTTIVETVDQGRLVVRSALKGVAQGDNNPCNDRAAVTLLVPEGLGNLSSEISVFSELEEDKGGQKMLPVFTPGTIVTYRICYRVDGFLPGPWQIDNPFPEALEFVPDSFEDLPAGSDLTLTEDGYTLTFPGRERRHCYTYKMKVPDCPPCDDKVADNRICIKSLRVADAPDDNCSNVQFEMGAAPASLKLPADFSGGCDSDISPKLSGEATVDSKCEYKLSFKDDDPVIKECRARFDRIWIAEDACGNTLIGTQRIEYIKYDTPPRLTCPDDLIIGCNDALPEADLESVTIEEGCGSVVVSVVTNRARERDCSGVIPLMQFVFTAIDACGNRAECIRKVFVKDSTPPRIECAGDTKVACGEELPKPSDDDVKTEDECGDVKVEISTEEFADADRCAKGIIVTYVAIDACGNINTCSRRIYQIDEDKPEILCPDGKALACGEEVPEPDPTSVRVRDCSKVDVRFVETVRKGEAGCEDAAIIHIFEAVDACGNASRCEQVFTVSKDTLAPEIRCPADREFTCGEDFPKPSIDDVTVRDNCGKSEVDMIVRGFSDRDRCISGMEITYIAKDACGNAATCSYQMVKTDRNPPRFESKPPEDRIITCESDAIEWICLKAVDDCSGEMEVCPKSQVVTLEGCDYLRLNVWTAMDGCGNEVSLTQTITVLASKAVFAFDDVPADEKVACGERIDEPPALVIAGCGGLARRVLASTTRGEEDCSTVWQHLWKATNRCGVVACATQKIYVIDRVAPIMECPEAVTLMASRNCAAETPEIAVRVKDACGTVKVEQSPAPGAEIALGESITITAMDACGNKTSCVVKVAIEGCKTGELQIAKTVYLGHDDGASCPGKELVSGPAGGAITWCFTVCNPGPTPMSSVVISDATLGYFAEVGDLAVGDCKVVHVDGKIDGCVTNIATASGLDEADRLISDDDEAIVKEDICEPVLVCPDDQVLSCDEKTDVDATGRPFLLGRCCGELNMRWEDSELKPECPVIRSIVRRFEMEDECGNRYRCEQRIEVRDTVAPTLKCPETLEVSADKDCIAVVPDLMLAEDLCSEFIVKQDPPAGTEFEEFAIVEIIAEDACGNRSRCLSLLTTDCDDGLPDDDEIVKLIIPEGSTSCSMEAFPVKIERCVDWLKLVEHGGKQHLDEDGELRLAFADGDGGLLPYEIESYDGTSGCLTAWVLTPIDAAEDTCILLGYGPRQENLETPNTWDEDFVLVHHMKEVDGVLVDSTRYGNNGNIDGPILNTNCSVAGQGLWFDGKDDGVLIAHDESLNLKGCFTLESWFYAETIQCRYLFTKGSKPGGDYYQMLHNESMKSEVAGIGDAKSTTAIPYGQWNHIVFVFEPGPNDWGPHTYSYYLNGELVDRFTKTGTQQCSSADLILGNLDFKEAFFEGCQDEIRFSKTCRDACWIKASHDTVVDDGFVRWTE